MTDLDRVKEAKANVLAALDALVRAELATADPGAWQRVRNVAGLGVQLRNMKLRPEDPVARALRLVAHDLRAWSHRDTGAA